MRKAHYDDVPEVEKVGGGLPPRPDTCGVQGCTCAAAIMALTVRDGGRLVTGPAGNFGKVTGKGGGFELNSRYTFYEWHPRCYDHFLREQCARAGDRFVEVRAAGKLGSEVTNPLLDDEHVCEVELNRRISEERAHRVREVMAALARKLAA